MIFVEHQYYLHKWMASLLHICYLHMIMDLESSRRPKYHLRYHQNYDQLHHLHTHQAQNVLLSCRRFHHRRANFLLPLNFTETFSTSLYPMLSSTITGQSSSFTLESYSKPSSSTILSVISDSATPSPATPCFANPSSATLSGTI